MTKYGQFCPIAKALEFVGDRWTLLIIRDMLMGTSRFNDLERGLPRISRALLASRLRQLQRAGLVEKRPGGEVASQAPREYHLTQAGRELFNVIDSLKLWGETWAFAEPTEEDLDPVLLMWWLHNRVDVSTLPSRRVVVQFDFHGTKSVSFWLILAPEDVSLCLTDPGYPIDLLVEADLATFFKVWGGQISYQQALSQCNISVEGITSLARAFPRWFGWGVPTPREKAELPT
jgi:DNA-binding HxlR family transcriptional regulator